MHLSHWQKPCSSGSISEVKLMEGSALIRQRLRVGFVNYVQSERIYALIKVDIRTVCMLLYRQDDRK